MFRHRFDQKLEIHVILHWFMLSFNGGSINAGGFLATGRFVTHVTGFATLFGVDLASSQLQAALGILSVPFFFLLGAFLAGIFIERPIFKGKRPRFDWVMGISAFCLFIAASMGWWFHGPFFSGVGVLAELKESYVLLALLCLSSGLQNAAITSSSGRTFRTTHLTGQTTDLGLGLARLFTFGLNKQVFYEEARLNYLRIGAIASFVAGSVFGGWMFLRLGYTGFIVPGLLSVYAAWQGKKSLQSA